LTLTALRAALGPAVLAFAFLYPNSTVFAVCLVVAFLSDYFDGVLLLVGSESLHQAYADWIA